METLKPALINEFLCKDYPSVDLFLTNNKQNVHSCTNGSAITCDSKRYTNVIQQLDAVLLWDKKGFNKSFKCWKQSITHYANFAPPSILPEGPNELLLVRRALFAVEKKLGVAPFFSGANHEEISIKIIQLIEANLTKPQENEVRSKANGFYFNFALLNEYDFQNFILLALRPVFPDIETESPTIKIGDSDKKADFSLINSSIIIEAKWIDNASKRSSVVKTLKGLASFYSRNANVKSLIFLILIEENVKVDFRKLEKTYSSSNPAEPIFVKCFRNPFGRTEALDKAGAVEENIKNDQRNKNIR